MTECRFSTVRPQPSGACHQASAAAAIGQEGLQGGGEQCLCCLQAFLRGILANWLVNIAIWQATASSSIGGKVLP